MKKVELILCASSLIVHSSRSMVLFCGAIENGRRKREREEERKREKEKKRTRKEGIVEEKKPKRKIIRKKGTQKRKRLVQ